MFLLGYDIGSSTIKVSLINADSHEVIKVVQYPEREMDMISRQRGWAEQQPELWWRNLRLATQKLLLESEIDAHDIKGIGIAYQMHGLVLVDKDLQVLRPAIIWCDSRAVSIGDQAFREIGQEYCLRNLLNSPGNFTASKLRWVKDNEPGIYNRIYKILLPGDFIAMKLTGEVGTTISGLSEGIFWNFKERQVDQRLLDYFEIDQSILSPVSPTFSVLGEVSKKAAEQTGLVAGTPVCYRAGDQPNNAVSLRVLDKGEVAATSGTSGVLYGIVDTPVHDEHSRINSFAHVNYEDNFDRIGVLLCINGAGIQYSWIKHQIALGQTSYRDMERMVSSVPEGSEGVCILPFGNGSERIFDNRNLESHIYNLEFNRHTRAHLFRASLEGVAFTFVYGMNMLKDLGMDVDVIRVGNDNMFQSKAFSMTISTLLGIPIEVVDTTGATGAARAAGVGSGIYNSLEEALTGIKPYNVFEPGLNYAMCSQAYSYWLASLNRLLYKSRDRASGIKSLEAQNSALKQAVRTKNSLLAEQKLQLEAKDDLLHNLKHQLKELQQGAGRQRKGTQDSTIQKLLSSISESEYALGKVEEHFDVLHDEFVVRLKEKYPDLNYDELRMCVFLKLKLSTKEIASRMNLSVRGVETKRYRLRQKLNLVKGGSLARFVATI